MKGYRLVVLMIAIMIVASCQQELPPTPTVIPTLGPLPLDVNTVSPVRLVRHPRAFEGRYVLLVGQYQPKPPLICRSESHSSPATWELLAEEVAIPAAGSDSALRALDDGNLKLELIGLWKRWSGQIGCGRDAPIRHQWYLEVNEILSPNPIVAAGTTGNSQADQVDEPDLEAEATATEASITLTAQPAETGSLETDIAPTPVETPGPSVTATTTPEGEDGPVDGVTATPSNTPDHTATAVSTPSPTATAGPTDVVETATATPTTAPTPTTTEIDFVAGSIVYDDIRKDFLAPGMTHRWEFAGEADELVFIAVAAAPSLDASLEFLGPDQVSLGLARGGLQGETESLGALDIPVTGEYEIVVQGVGGTSGHYAVLIQTDDSLPFIIMRDNIIYGGGSSGTIPEDTDHFWNFMGQEGEVISLALSPVGDYDLVLYLIGPNGLELDFVDDTGTGSDEVIMNYQLPSAGYYSVGVGEVQFDEANYILTLDNVQ